MVWRFTRGDETLTCTLIREGGSLPYRLVVERPDQPEVVERIEKPTDLVQRTSALVNELLTDGWDLLGA